MITFEQLKEFFPDTPTEKIFVQHMVKEYLQTIILGKLSKNAIAADMIFIGGTSLRFFYGLDRFSEDLDFDYTGNDRDDARPVFDDISKKLNQEGFNCFVEHNHKDTDNFCKIYFSNLSDHFPLPDKRKKIWIKIDIQKNFVSYKTERHFVNRFGLYYPISLPDKSILFSMKAIALTQRVKARDMYDFSFLSAIAKLDKDYISHELNRRGIHIKTIEDLKHLILSNEKTTDINEKMHEIRLFITNKENTSRVAYFYHYVQNMNFPSLV
jgi:predicted nucleotidyltransferase component of viral defense system